VHRCTIFWVRPQIHYCGLVVRFYPHDVCLTTTLLKVVVRRVCLFCRLGTKRPLLRETNFPTYNTFSKVSRLLVTDIWKFVLTIKFAFAKSMISTSPAGRRPQQDFLKWVLSTPTVSERHSPLEKETAIVQKRLFYFLICDCQISRISLILNVKAAVSRQDEITSDSNLLRCLLLIQSHKYVPAIL
jgi:hypothetical protein